VICSPLFSGILSLSLSFPPSLVAFMFRSSFFSVLHPPNLNPILTRGRPSLWLFHAQRFSDRFAFPAQEQNNNTNNRGGKIGCESVCAAKPKNSDDFCASFLLDAAFVVGSLRSCGEPPSPKASKRETTALPPVRRQLNPPCVRCGTPRSHYWMFVPPLPSSDRPPSRSR